MEFVLSIPQGFFRLLPLCDIPKNDSSESLAADPDMRDRCLQRKLRSIGSYAEQCAGSYHRMGSRLSQGKDTHMPIVFRSRQFRNEAVEWLSNRVGALAEKHGFRRSVDEHHTLPLIHRDDGIHCRRDNPPKLRLMRRQLLLCPFAITDVEKCRPPMGDMPRVIVNRKTLEMNPLSGAGLFPKPHITILSCACHQDILAMPTEGILMIPRDDANERVSDQLFSTHPHEDPRPHIGLYNLALCIQREMAGRGKIVEVEITVARRFKLDLGPAQLVVLHVELDLVNLYFVHERLHIIDRHGRDVTPCRLEHFLSLLSEPLRFLQRVWFLGHRSVLL